MTANLELDYINPRDVVVNLSRVNWDDECRLDLLTKKGFVIFEKTYKDKDKKIKSEHGLQSPKFGTDWEDENAFEDRYSCKCKKYMGMYYEGEICEECGTAVIYKDVDINMTGWIIIKGYNIIQPMYYHLLASVIGVKGEFLETITPQYEIDRDGKIVDTKDFDDKATAPFAGIGISGLEERFEEVLEFYRKKRKDKKTAMIDLLLKEKNNIFASCIPVYSSVLRPEAYSGGEYSYTRIDSKLNGIRVKAGLINNLYENQDEFDSETFRLVHSQNILISIQKKIMEIDKLVSKHIEGKDGHVRNELHGGRINYSGRAVIIPNPRLKADEVEFSYVVFLELYRLELIGLISKMMNVSRIQASNIWSASTTSFNPLVYQLMEYMIEKFQPVVGINRNPTINWGSAIAMRVIRVIKSDNVMDNTTITLPIAVLDDMNADFDGDILNIISFKYKELEEAFEKFNPRTSMFIDRNDGLFNSRKNLHKDLMIGLYNFNTM